MAELRLTAGRLDFFRTAALGAQLDLRDRVNLEEGWHPALQTWWPWRLPRTVGRVEEQRAIDLNRNRRLVELITRAGQVLAKELLVGGVRCRQRSPWKKIGPRPPPKLPRDLQLPPLLPAA